MGNSENNTGKTADNARKRTWRRVKRLLTGLFYFALMAAAIWCVAAMPRINRTPPRQNSWFIQKAKDDAIARAASRAAAADAQTASGDTQTASGDTQTASDDAQTARNAQQAPSDAADATGAQTADAQGENLPADSGDAAADGGEAAPVDDGPVTITVTAAGDCTLGGSVNQNTYDMFKKVVQTYGYDYFFSNVRSIFQADDLTVVNLEGPLTDVGKGKYGSYCFKGDPDYVQILSGSSVELCNVANNHSADFGVEGLQRTAEVLEQANVGCCGYTKVYHTTIKGVRITALGFDKWHNDKDGIVGVIQQERPNCDLLIVNMHWGREKHFEPMADQKTVGHAAIDAGADLVIGTHPHVYGGVELYKGRYIAYSLGNFCFGGNDNPTDKRCLIFQQTFIYNGEGVTMGDGGINVIPCMVSSVANKNDLKPTVMEAKAGTALLKAIARYSNFSKDGTLWMRNSYPEQIGLIQGDAQTDAAGQTAEPLYDDSTSAEQAPADAPSDAEGDAEIDEETRLRQLYQEQMMTE